MADALIDFSELENDENCCPDEDQENRAPNLLQSPVIVNPILKQSTKDNLIQLFTPVQKPVKGKLKVTFGQDSVLQTPVVKKNGGKRTLKPSDVTLEVIPKPEIQTTEVNEDKEKEDWEERTSILTSIDHQEYVSSAKEFIHEIIQSIPIKEDENTSLHSVDSGVESNAMDCSEYELEPAQELITTEEDKKDMTVDADDFTFSILSQATELIKSLQQETYIDIKKSDDVCQVLESEEEFMDCHEYMEVDDDATPKAVIGDKPAPRSVVTEGGVGTVTEVKVGSGETADSCVGLALDKPQDDTDATCSDQQKLAGNVQDVSDESKSIEGKPTSTQPGTEDRTVDEPQTGDRYQESLSSEKDVANTIEANKTSATNTTQDTTEEQPIMPKSGGYNLDGLENSTEEQPIMPKSGGYNLDGLENNTEEQPILPKSGGYNLDGLENNTEEQPILPKSGGYNIDGLENNTEEQPIMPKSGGYNIDGLENNTEEQPILPKSGGYNLDGLENNTEEQPIMPKSGGYNLDALENNTEEQPMMPKSGGYNLDALENNTEEQPIMPKSGGYNLDGLENNTEEQPIMPKSCGYNLDGLENNTEEQPIMPKSGGYNLDALENNTEEQPIMPKSGGYNLDGLENNTEEQPIIPKSGGYNLDGLENNTEEQPILPKRETDILDKVENTEESILPQKAANDTDGLNNTEEQPILPKKGVYNLDDFDNTEEIPILPKKGVYNLDELDLESMDPFKTKSQVVNTPEKLDKTKTEHAALAVPGENETADSTPLTVPGENKSCEGGDKVLDEINEQVKTKEDCKGTNNVDTVKESQIQVVDSTAAPEELKEMNIQLNEIEDPFKPKSQMQNSPLVKKNEWREVNMDEIEDPFKPRNQMQNSPLSALRSDTKSDSDVPKAPAKSEDENPFKPRSQIVNSPAAGSHKQSEIPSDSGVDPFKTGTQLQNSPVVAKTHSTCEDKVQQQNNNLEKQDSKTVEHPEKKVALKSPVMEKEKVDTDGLEISLKVTKKIESSPLNAKSELNFEEITDPFQPKVQMQNSPSPVIKENTKAELIFEEIDDPFKPKKQVQNSPLLKENQAADIKFEEMEDPFKPSQQMNNSPLTKNLNKVFEEVKDPFKSGQQINSLNDKHRNPDTALVESNDLLMSKMQQTELLDDKAKCDKPNLKQAEAKADDKVGFDSPFGILDMESLESLDSIEDPFKPRAQMQNSPDTNKKTTMGEVTEVTALSDKETKRDAFDDIDPFKTTRQIPQSPIINKMDEVIKEDPSKTVEQEPSKENTDTDALTGSDNQFHPSVSLFPDGLEGEVENDFIEITSVTRRGEQPKDAIIGDFDGLDIDESQFVSAAKVFNDPGMLDLLESFGNSGSNQESSLSRMSLYVKFDPLVEAAPNRRISILPSQIEKMREFGLDETLLLLGTPPKKKRQTMSVTSLRNTPNVPSPLAIVKDKVPAVQPGAVDMLLACSPGKLKETPTSSKRSAVPSLLGDMDEGGSALFEELKYTETDLRRVKDSCKMEMQGMVLEKEREWYGKEQAQQKETEKLQHIINELKIKYEESEAKCTEFKEIFNMYELTMVDLTEKHKGLIEKKDEEIKAVEVQRDTAFKDLKSVDNAFSELHTRYDKVRNIIDVMKKNEDALKKYISECHDKLKEKETTHTSMKKTYEEKCKTLHQENEKLKQQVADLTNKSAAQTKVSQMKIESLEKQIKQKTAENKELTDICDNLLAGHPDA